MAENALWDLAATLRNQVARHEETIATLQRRLEASKSGVDDAALATLLKEYEEKLLVADVKWENELKLRVKREEEQWQRKEAENLRTMEERWKLIVESRVKETEDFWKQELVAKLKEAKAKSFAELLARERELNERHRDAEGKVLAELEGHNREPKERYRAEEIERRQRSEEGLLALQAACSLQEAEDKRQMPKELSGSMDRDLKEFSRSRDGVLVVETDRLELQEYQNGLVKAVRNVVLEAVETMQVMVKGSIDGGIAKIAEITNNSLETAVSKMLQILAKESVDHKNLKNQSKSIYEALPRQSAGTPSQSGANGMLKVSSPHADLMGLSGLLNAKDLQAQASGVAERRASAKHPQQPAVLATDAAVQDPGGQNTLNVQGGSVAVGRLAGAGEPRVIQLRDKRVAVSEDVDRERRLSARKKMKKLNDIHIPGQERAEGSGRQPLLEKFLAEEDWEKLQASQPAGHIHGTGKKKGRPSKKKWWSRKKNGGKKPNGIQESEALPSLALASEVVAEVVVEEHDVALEQGQEKAPEGVGLYALPAHQ